MIVKNYVFPFLYIYFKIGKKKKKLFIVGETVEWLMNYK